MVSFIMTDEQILKEIEDYIIHWLKPGGWAEENAGFSQVLDMIEYLRKKDILPKNGDNT